MDRRHAGNSDRARTALAIGASIAVHALVLSSVTLDLPAFGADETPRPLRVIELPDDRRSPALEVVPLETAAAFEPASPTAGASRSAADAERPASPASAALAAPVATAPPGAPRRATISTALDLTPADETATPDATLAAARPARGIILRADAGEAAEPGLRFHAASDAARDAEEDEREDAGPGRGIGISISGPGRCPGGAGIPAIGIGGGLGGVPTTGKGMGIIGARPPNRGAINRAAPPIGGGR